MSKPILPYTALLMLVLLANVARAQPLWTFEQVLNAARATHPSVRGKQSAQAAARAEREGAEWQRYPTPSMELSRQQGGADSGQNTSVLRVDQPLWTGGRISAGIDAAGSQLEAAGAAVDEARLDLDLRVIAVYLEALRQKARQQHAIAAVKEHEKLRDMIRRRVEQEVSPLADQRLAESRLAQTANELSLATQGYHNALAQLAQLAGQSVADIDPLHIDPQPAPATFETTLGQAESASPALRRLAAEESAASAVIAAKRAAWWPQLSLRLEKAMSPEDDNRALLVLLAQPGAGLSSVAGVEAAIARREAVRMDRLATLRDLRERISLDWNEWTAARVRLDNAEQARATSTEVFESYSRQYTAGRKSWLDVLNAVREAMQSEFSVDDARTQALAADLRLRARIGTLTPTTP